MLASSPQGFEGTPLTPKQRKNAMHLLVLMLAPFPTHTETPLRVLD
jgi:hypothetical protein